MYSFTISGDVSTLTVVSDPRVSYSDSSCKQDYVIIAGGSQTGDFQDSQFALDRYCGSTLGYCGRSSSTATTCGKKAGPVISKRNIII